ncbi:arylsulfatase B [Verrucomicrobium spinosum]|uniref:arylsulfatase B n=1 Tax=Verrucomicrobium spinosum TaxID=2736 RepID=UPI0009EA15BD|nr:arylsulfatase [Verrucomicrobium spinosum]
MTASRTLHALPPQSLHQTTHEIPEHHPARGTLAASLLPQLPLAAAPSAPNIIHIVADDLGWQDVGFNGCKDIQTPHLDALAKGGARFTQFYVQPMCTPTRAALMTGRYPFRYGLQTAVIPSVSTYGLDTGEYLLPQCLQDAGYTTAIIGKWHLGHADKKFWPKQRGFEYQYGAMIGELDYYTHSEHGVLDWFRDNEPVHEEGYTTNLLGADAVKYLEKQKADRPFYLYLAFNAPHTPYQAPQEYIDRYTHIADPTRRTYAGMVACLDDNIGRVVAALDKKGLRENTLILFHSDNGGTHNPMFAGVMADVSKIKIPCDNSPYRDGKGSLFEGGVRVCALANWPGKIKPATVDGLIHATDIFTTFTKLAGASTSRCKPLDGVDAWPTMAEGRPSLREEVVYNVEPYRAALRQGDWKLIWRTTLPSSVDLYNLAADPFEKTNLADGQPEKVASMKLRLDELARGAAKPLFLVDQLKVVMKNMNGEPVLPGEDGFGEAERDAAPAAPGH